MKVGLRALFILGQHPFGEQLVAAQRWQSKSQAPAIGMALVVLGICVGCQRKSENPIVHDFVKHPPVSEANEADVKRGRMLGADISAALGRNRDLEDAAISVSVSNLNGEVTLMGLVKRPSQIGLALKIARQIAKNAKIVNRLQIPLRSTVGTNPAKVSSSTENKP